MLTRLPRLDAREPPDRVRLLESWLKSCELWLSRECVARARFLCSDHSTSKSLNPVKLFRAVGTSHSMRTYGRRIGRRSVCHENGPVLPYAKSKWPIPVPTSAFRNARRNLGKDFSAAHSPLMPPAVGIRSIAAISVDGRRKRRLRRQNALCLNDCPACRGLLQAHRRRSVRPRPSPMTAGAARSIALGFPGRSPAWRSALVADHASARWGGSKGSSAILEAAS